MRLRDPVGYDDPYEPIGGNRFPGPFRRPTVPHLDVHPGGLSDGTRFL